MTLTNAGESNAGCILAAFKEKGVSAGNAVNAYSKGGKSGLSSGSILALASGTLRHFTFFLMIRRPPRSTQGVSSAASDVYKRQQQQPTRNNLGRHLVS